MMILQKYKTLPFRQGTFNKLHTCRRRIAGLPSALMLQIVAAAFFFFGPLSVDAAQNAFSFTGNTFFTSRELLKAAGEDMDMAGDSVHSKAAVDDAAFGMELFYRQAGFAFAEVGYEFKTNKEGNSIVFHIREGPRVALHSLEFAGKLSYDPVKLRSFFKGSDSNGFFAERKSYYVRDHLGASLSALGKFYINDGFLDVRVADPTLVFTPQRDAVDVTIAVEEGPRYRVRHVDFSGDQVDAFSEKLEEIRHVLLESPYYPRLKLLLQSRIVEVYANAGYPDVLVDVSMNRDPATGDVRLSGAVKSGEKVRISEVKIRGNERTLENFIKSRVRLQSGELYTREKARETFSLLYDTGLFSRVDVELGKAEGNTSRRPLEVSVEEVPVKEFYIEPGWGSYEMLTLTTGFEHKNLFGTGRLARAEGKLTMKGELFSLRFVDPWFLGSQTVADVPFSYLRREEPSFTRHELGGSFMVTRDLRKRLSLTLGYHLKMSDISDIDEIAEGESPETTYNTGSIKAQLTWDTRDDYFFPQNGERLAGAVEVAHAGLGSELEFIRLTLGARSFFHLPGDTVLGLRYDTGLILPGAKNVSLPLGEKFFNGGENSVRSFKEARLGPLDSSGDPVGGLGYNTITMELRKRFFRNLSASLFADFGNVTPNRSRSELGLKPFESHSDVISATTRDFFSDLRPGLGVGIQYFLPIGPARLDFAFNPDNDPDRDEPDMVVHFSLGMAF
ncbi:MAG: outer membrane protein assembly factor BamA [Desulfobulbaceae bacterium]|nr:outer membrane protein assembly factor BamA [Desulfobulbaceae bacterium]